MKPARRAPALPPITARCWVLAGVLLAGCPGGGTLDPPSSPPTAPSIALEPADPATSDALGLVITEEATDPDGDLAGYQVRWFRDGTPQPAQDDTYLVPATATARGETWTAEVVAVDEEDRASEPVQAQATVLNTPPVASVAIEPPTPTTTDPLVLAIETEDPDGDDIALEVGWTLDGTPMPSFDGFHTLPAAQTARGQAWTVTVTPRDDVDTGASEQATTTVLNTPPAVVSVTLAPTDPREGDLLTASAETADPDGDATTLSWSWSLDGVEVPGVTADTLDASHWDKGDEVQVTATAADDLAEGAPRSSAPVTIQDTPPTAPAVAVGPVPAKSTHDLTCTLVTPSTDIDGDPVTYDAVWLHNDTPTAHATTGAGADLALVLPASATSPDESWACRITPRADGLGGPAATGDAPVLGHDQDCWGVTWTAGARATGAVMTYPDRWTLEAWIRPDGSFQTSSTRAAVLSIPGDAACGPNDQDWQILLHQDGRVSGQLERGGPATPTAGSWTEDAWLHVALQYHGDGTGSLWVDGRHAQTFEDVDAGWDDACPLHIGGNQHQEEHFAGGALASLRLSGTVRYTSPFAPSGRLARDADTTWLFTFDEQQGTTAHDTTGTAALDIAELDWLASDQACPTSPVCPEGRRAGCDGGCLPDDWLGDLRCDATLDCDTWSADDGDCATCQPGEIIACDGSCQPASWLGDLYCDATLACDTWYLDDGDCAEGTCSSIGWTAGTWVRGAIMSYPDQWTIEGWFRPDGTFQTSLTRAAVLSIPGDEICGPAFENWHVQLHEDGTVDGWLEQYGPSTNSAGTWTADAWLHFALQYHGDGTGSLYVDGELAQTYTEVDAGWDPSCELYLGGNQGSEKHYTGGDLSSVRLSSLVRYGEAFTPSPTLDRDADTVWAFGFDELAGTIASDPTGTPTLDVGAVDWIADGPTCETPPDELCTGDGTADCPATSCLGLRQSDDTLEDGIYWLQPDGTGEPFEAWCDMTTDGGGWTLLFSAADMDETTLGSLACCDAQGVYRAYSTVPIQHDVRLDGSDTAMTPTGAEQQVEVLFQDVPATTAGHTLRALLTGTDPHYLDADDNSNVDLWFDATTGCDTWGNFGAAVCQDTAVVTLNDRDGSNAPHLFGVSASSTEPWTNLAGWPDWICGTYCTAQYWPRYLRVWVR